MNKKPDVTGLSPERVKANIKGEQLFDTKPIQSRHGKFYEQISLIGRKSRMRSTAHLSGQRNIRSYDPPLEIKDIELITSPWKRKILDELREKSGYAKGDKTRFFKPDEIIRANLPFRTVTIEKRGVGASAVRKINNNVFRVASDVNTHIMVYSTTDKRLKAVAVKNKRIFKDVPKPSDFGKELFRFKKGDIVNWKYRNSDITGKVTKCLTKGAGIDITDVSSDKTFTGKNPVYIQWVRSAEGKLLFEK